MPQHWVVYHSQEIMKQSYSSLTEATVYSTKQQPKLCNGDIIWVIEGDTNQPKRYALADCFPLLRCDDPPRFGAFAGFKLRCIGAGSLQGGAIPLSTDSMAWFKELHARFLTKQRFFVRLQEPEIISGLLKVSGVQI